MFFSCNMFTKVIVGKLLHKSYNIFIIKKLLHIKWDVIIPPSFRLLLKVWIWNKCQNRLENRNYITMMENNYALTKKVHMKTQTKAFILQNLWLQETKDSNLLYSQPLNSGQLRVLKSLSVIKRCPLLGRIVTFGTKHIVRYSTHIRYLGCPLLGDFTVFDKNCIQENVKCHIQHEDTWLRWIVIEQVNYK